MYEQRKHLDFHDYREEFSEVRRLIISMVLATDMKRHNAVMDTFRTVTSVFPKGATSLRTVSG